MPVVVPSVTHTLQLLDTDRQILLESSGYIASAAAVVLLIWAIVAVVILHRQHAALNRFQYRARRG